mmetsp:Transcript_132712/g.383700  ORF Transcript_132712/g.383700 Transcript_132712/m.383700 type:complete len:279 (+) Transcript_132712:281-1117(+)
MTSSSFAMRSTCEGQVCSGLPKACPGPMVQTANGSPSLSRPMTSTEPSCIMNTLGLRVPYSMSFSPFLKCLVATIRWNSVRLCADNVSAIWSTSRGWRSGMTINGNIPMKHPKITPSTRDNIMKYLTKSICCCANVSFGSGKPRRSAKRSITPCRVIPDASETICPIPADASVEKPKATPKVQSMVSPTVSMIILSKKPKPMKGIAVRAISFRNWIAVGLPTCRDDAESTDSARGPEFATLEKVRAHRAAVLVSIMEATRRIMAGSSRNKSAMRAASP